MPQVAAFAMGAFGVGSATALGATAAWSAGAAFAGTALGSAVLQLTTSVALSALSRALGAGKTGPAAGIRSDDTLNGGVNPEAFILGRYATSGAFVAPRMSHGASGKTPNAYLTYVIEVAGVAGHQLEGLILNGERVEVHSAEPHADYGRRVGGRYLDRAWVRYYDGTQTAADPMLLAKYPAPHVRPWSADMVGRGVCYAVLTFLYDREVYQSWPEVRFEMRGLPLYNPVTGVTAHTDNPMIMIYNILRGITLATGLVWGAVVPAADLPAAQWAAAIDACNVQVDDGADGLEPQYRAGLEVIAEDEPFSVIEELLKACGGALAEQGGVWVPRVGGPGLPVMAITDADLIADAPDELAPFPPPSEIYNAIEATCPDPAAMWESRDLPPLYDADWEAQDGGRRLSVSVSFPTAPYPVQVERLMSALIKDHRRLLRHVITLPPDAVPLQPLDVIVWSSTANGYGAKQFEVAETTRQLLTGRVQVVLREVDPSDWGVPTGLVRPDVPNLIADLPAAQSVPGWSVQPYTVVDAASKARRPALRLSWDPEAAIDARGIRWAIRRTGEGGAGAVSALHDAGAGEAIIDSVLPGTSYDVRARFVVNRKTAWSSWISAVTPDVRLSPSDLDAELVADLAELHDWIDGDRLGRLDQEILDEIAAREAELAARDIAIQAVADQITAETLARVDGAQLSADRWRSERDRVRQSLAQIVELASHDHAAREEIRRSLTVQLGDMGASFSEQIVTLASETGAAALRITSLEATSGDLQSAITQAEIARVDGDNALASLISQISVGSAVQFDHAKIWYWDTTVEGWTGSPSLPAVSGGWLRPAVGSDLISPAGLGVSAEAYQQIRARIRRVGAPVWTGVVWWAGVSQGWDALRSMSVPEPLWDGAEAILTLNVPWDGVIDRVRLQIAAVTAVELIELDWIAIGRPAPGASSAELLAERQARIGADEALAGDLLSLDARLETAEEDLIGQASAVSGLQSRVTDVEDGIEVQSERIDTLRAEVDNPVTGLGGLAQAIDQLTSTVTDGSAGAVYQAQSVRSLKSQARALAAEAIDAAAAEYERTREVRDYVAEAAQTLTTRIDLTDAEVRVVAEAVTLLQARIPDLATAQALSALSAQVVDQGGVITTTANAITSLQSSIDDIDNELGTKLDASVISSYDTKAQVNDKISVATSAATTSLKSSLEGSGGSIALAQAAAQDAADIAGGKGRVFFQSTAPAASERLAQNLWIDTTGGNNTPKRWNGSTWVAVTDKVATDAAAAAANAMSLAATKLDASVISDYYTKTQTDGRASTAAAAATTALKASLEGAGGSIALAQAAAQDASTLAGGKGRVFFQTSAPAASERLAQNLWIDTTGGNNTPKRWNGSTWVAVTDKVATDAALAAANAQSLAATKLDATAISNYYTKTQADDRSAAAAAAATTSLKAQLEGAGGSIALAQAAAQDASTLAGGKGRVFFQTSAPAASDRLAQNLWIDTTGGANTPKRWNGSAWVAVTDKVATDAAAAAANALSVANTKLNASAISDYYTKTQTDGRIASATASATTSLKSELETGSIKSAQDAANAAADLAGSKGKVLVRASAPPAADRLAQNLWIDITGGSNTPKRWDGAAWVAVTDKVATDAAQAASNALSVANTKASAEAVSDLTTRVSNNEGAITSVSDRLDTVSSRVDTVRASGRFRVTTEATPSGAQSRIGLKATATTGEADDTRTAAMFLEAVSGGASRAVFDADTFAIVQGAGRVVPFTVSDGVVQIKSALIGDAAITSAKIANVLQSDNFVAGTNGSGWRIRKDGSAEFNEVSIRRQLAVAEGHVDLLGYHPVTATGWSPGTTDPSGDWAVPSLVKWVQTTPIAISEWQGARRTYIATAGMSSIPGQGSVSVEASSGRPPDVYWGWDAQVLPLTRWEPGDIGQTLRLRLTFWSRNVTGLSNMRINWKIYEVS